MKKQLQRIVLLSILPLLCLVLLAGCSAAPAETTTPTEPSDTEISYEEGISDADSIVNTTAADKVILVVSFGTSYNQSRSLTIGGIEAAIREAYPDYQIRRAFTSQIIIDKLAERDNLNIDNIGEAMDRLVLDKVKEVIIQPTTIMNGYEYDDVIAEVMPYAEKFSSLKIGKWLLADDSDYDAVAEIMAAETAKFAADDTAIVWMGHGTSHPSDATYAKLQNVLHDQGYSNHFVGVVEGALGLESVQEKLAEAATKKVIMRPLMIVAGDHANNDMAGDEEDSWTTILTADGYTVENVLEGLGQIKAIQEIFVKHVEEGIDSINLPEIPADSTASITAASIKDGIYPIEVSSSSSMFRIIDAQLNVNNGEMSAVLTLSGEGYEKLYMGTGEEAAADSDDKCIYFVEDSEGKYTYTVPVEALDQDTDVAAWSIRKKTWYDRVLVFQSALIPDEAFIR